MVVVLVAEMSANHNKPTFISELHILHYTRYFFNQRAYFLDSYMSDWPMKLFTVDTGFIHLIAVVFLGESILLYG